MIGIKRYYKYYINFIISWIFWWFKNYIYISYEKWGEIENIECDLSCNISILFERLDKKIIEIEEENLKIKTN